MNVTLRSGKVLDDTCVTEVDESSKKHSREEEDEEDNVGDPNEPVNEKGKAEIEEEGNANNEEVQKKESEQAEKERGFEDRRLEPIEVTCRERQKEDREVPSEISKNRGNLSPRHEKRPEKKKKKKKGKVPTEGELNEKLEKQQSGNWNHPDQKPPSPYPMVPKDSQQFKNFMQILKDVVLNISMYDLICGVPKYGKFVKDLLSGRKGE